MKDQNQNDETLVLLTLAGEPSAYEVLVARHQKTVVTAAASVTHNLYMAEDAAQDAFVTAWMKLNTLQEPQKFAIWVCRIAKNCALNMITRYRGFLPLDIVEHLNLSDDRNQNPAELYLLSEETDELYQEIGNLPEKIKQIIRLHYFEGLSVTEIADQMRISAGTVKRQLHDGRKRIRKELCAMNEQYYDTLVQRVMKKVEELKLWQVINNKSGFASVYRNVLREVDELPESGDKYHALADVLMRGWWWLPGEKNDALFARIKEAAQTGRNDEVMEFIVIREDSQVYGGVKIEFMRDKQIPMLEKAGFVHTLAREWFWLGYQYFRNRQPEEGLQAYERAMDLLKPSDMYYSLIPLAREMEQKLSTYYNGKKSNQYLIGIVAEELRYICNTLRYWKRQEISEGNMNSLDRGINDIFRNSSHCDGYFFDSSLALGTTYTGSDGTTLTFASDCETVETACGIFRDCQLWITKYRDDYGNSISQSYYKDGIGIVKHVHTLDGLTDVRVLKSYRLTGGEGLLPLAAGNTWEYSNEYSPSAMRAELKFQVSHADEKSFILSSCYEIERLHYDENSWLDMIDQIRTEYWKEENGKTFPCDVSHAIERAELLAITPMEKAHTKSAGSVVRRIMETNTAFHPDQTATGHWNFFVKRTVDKRDGLITTFHNFRWSFEWKQLDGKNNVDTPLLFNDIYGILQDAAQCIWSDEWKVGASLLVEYILWETRPVRTQILCQDGGTIATKAGIFEHCLVLSLDIAGMDRGLSYRGGKKKYYFADGIGIVRTENQYCGGTKTAVYELTSYQGTGDGYMPISDGMTRRYDALDLTDGYVGAAEYTFVQDEEGVFAIFEDRTGIRKISAS